MTLQKLRVSTAEAREVGKSRQAESEAFHT
jgi:hypothetical protein